MAKVSLQVDMGDWFTNKNGRTVRKGRADVGSNTFYITEYQPKASEGVQHGQGPAQVQSQAPASTRARAQAAKPAAGALDVSAVLAALKAAGLLPA